MAPSQNTIQDAKIFKNYYRQCSMTKGAINQYLIGFVKSIVRTIEIEVFSDFLVPFQFHNL